MGGAYDHVTLDAQVRAALFCCMGKPEQKELALGNRSAHAPFRVEQANIDHSDV